MFKHKFKLNKKSGAEMKANMGKADKSIRLILGVVIILLGLYFQTWWGVVGVIPIVTSFISWCPVYTPFRFSTISKHKDS